MDVSGGTISARRPGGRISSLDTPTCVSILSNRTCGGKCAGARMNSVLLQYYGVIPTCYSFDSQHTFVCNKHQNIIQSNQCRAFLFGFQHCKCTVNDWARCDVLLTEINYQGLIHRSPRHGQMRSLPLATSWLLVLANASLWLWRQDMRTCEENEKRSFLQLVRPGGSEGFTDMAIKQSISSNRSEKFETPETFHREGFRAMHRWRAGGVSLAGTRTGDSAQQGNTLTAKTSSYWFVTVQWQTRGHDLQIRL